MPGDIRDLKLNLQAQNTPPSCTTKTSNNNDNQIPKDHCKETINKIQHNMASMEPAICSPGNLNTPESQENDCKSNLIMMIEAFREETNKSVKETQEKISPVEALS